MTRFDLWATPLWVCELGLTKQFNDHLMSEISEIRADPGSDFNVWNHSADCLNKLKAMILAEVTEAVIGEGMPNQKLSLKRGWVNYHRPGSSLVMHNHGNATLACTYYIKAPKNSGDLLLVDPRGGVNWGWESEGSIVGVKHKRVPPVEGSLVFFPGFLLHSVEENKSQQARISLSSNIILV